MKDTVLLLATFLSLVLQVVFGDAKHTIPDQIIKFQSNVEVNLPGSSWGIKEFYDGYRKRSALIITHMGKTQRVINDRLNGEVLSLQELIINKQTVYRCTLVKSRQGVDILSFVNPSWLLREATQAKETYVPSAKPIRGIPVDQWTADIMVDGSKVKVDYFYSQKSWGNNYNLHQIPIRVKLTGSRTIDYDYYDFLDDIPDASVFQTPEGAYCPGRSSSKSIPMIPPQVSYRMEQSSPGSEAILSMDVWVDTRNNFVRIDYGKISGRGDNQLRTEVHDFNNDMNYQIDRVSGHCEISELSQSNKVDIDIDIAKNTSASGVTTVHMKHSFKMFEFNHDFQYTGQRYFNGILCDIFIAEVSDYMVAGTPFNLVTLEYYFTSDKWTEVSNKAAESVYNVPVLLRVKSLDMTYIKNYRFFDFDEGSMYLSAFDVTSCFKQEDKIDFQIDFTRPDNFLMAQKEEIQEECHMSLAKVSSITPLRIQHAKLYIEDNYIHFVATLVGLPPAKNMKNQSHTWVPTSKAWTELKDAVYQRREIVHIGTSVMVAVSVKEDVLNGANREMGSSNWQKMYSRLKDHIIGGHDELVLPGLAVDDCAAACTAAETFHCFSFDFCHSNGECRLSKETSIMNPQYLKPSTTCDLYTSNYETWFNKFPGQTVLPRLDVVYQRVGSAGQCATLCFNYGEFRCRSFDYCEFLQTCVIGRTHILDIPKSQVNIEPMCSHYSVKYIADFKKTSNNMLQLEDDEIIADISEEECAKICAENTNFICKSFDYCSDSQMCLYRSKHFRDIKGGRGLKPSAVCSHYTRQHVPTGKRLPSVSKPSKIGYSSGSMGALGFFMLIIGIGGALAAIFLYNRQKLKGKDSMNVAMVKDDAIY